MVDPTPLALVYFAGYFGRYSFLRRPFLVTFENRCFVQLGTAVFIRFRRRFAQALFL